MLIFDLGDVFALGFDIGQILGTLAKYQGGSCETGNIVFIYIYASVVYINPILSAADWYYLLHTSISL